MNKMPTQLIGAVFLFLMISGCSLQDDNSEYWPTHGWREASPEEMGMDSEKLAEMLRVMESSEIDSLTIIRQGYVVLDAYKFPYQPGRLHEILSCTKSITSALVGIAIDNNYIESVEQPLLEYFKDKNVTVDKDKKQSITLHHALTMTTGMDFRDSYLYDWENLKKMYRTENWADFVLNLPVKHTPGAHYEYSNITSFLLSAVIQEATGRKTAEFAEEYLFSKLGIRSYIWGEHSSGINLGYGNIRMNNLDLAKLGYLYLRNGRWEGEQVISRQWIEESTSSHVSQAKDGSDYGYQWWIDHEELFSAQGKGGQFIIVDRESDLVVVFTSSFPGLGDEPKHVYLNYIVPSLLSDKSVTANPEAYGALKEKTLELAEPVESKTGEIPFWLTQYNGKEIVYREAIFQTEKIRFEIDIEKNVMFLTHYDAADQPTKLQAGLHGEYVLNDVRPDLCVAAKADILENTIIWETAIPELAWKAHYNYQFTGDAVEVSVTDLNGSRFFTQGILYE